MLEHTDRSDDGYERRLALGFAALLATIAALVGYDLVEDYGGGTSVAHVVVEATVLALAAGGVALLLVRVRRLTRRTRELRRRLAETEAEAARWRSEARTALDGLGAAIARQFERWALSPAEREVGLLLLKGLSHRDVAELRGVSERTVRQQAQSLYRKAGVTGRADLSAFFLEDLLLPAAPAAEPVVQDGDRGRHSA